MFVNPQVIPAWFVAILMIMTGLMWIANRRVEIRVDSRIFAFTYIFEGVVYGITFQFFRIDTETRGFISRLLIVVLCLAQYIPLLVSYLRRARNG